MGMLDWFNNTYNKSKAAVVVQNLLERLDLLWPFNEDQPDALSPAKVANQLVAHAWNTKPDLFNGRFGNRPHKLSVAAYAVALGAEDMKRDAPLRPLLCIALGDIMTELQTNGRLYSFTNVDNFLFEKAISVFHILSQELEGDPLKPEIDNILASGRGKIS